MGTRLEYVKEMTFKIIEDCSPYYIRFTHEGIEDIINFACSRVPETSSFPSFKHLRFSAEDCETFHSMLPFKGILDFIIPRTSLFISKPGLYYRAHKDGVNHRFSINYCVKILDDKCVTSWYSDEDLREYSIDNLKTKSSRECIGFDKNKHTPIKSMVAKQGECVLFNTEIFHDWDNTFSQNERVVLTLRVQNPGQIYFNDAKAALFNLG